VIIYATANRFFQFLSFSTPAVSIHQEVAGETLGLQAKSFRRDFTRLGKAALMFSTPMSLVAFLAVGRW
jgi:hypothetical protein